jgi:hypothetical protein
MGNGIKVSGPLAEVLKELSKKPTYSAIPINGKAFQPYAQVINPALVLARNCSTGQSYLIKKKAYEIITKRGSVYLEL